MGWEIPTTKIAGEDSPFHSILLTSLYKMSLNFHSRRILAKKLQSLNTATTGHIKTSQLWGMRDQISPYQKPIGDFFIPLNLVDVLILKLTKFSLRS